MNGWSEGIAAAIDYIERHLTDEIDINKAAELTCLSGFYFQRLCGATVGEYIRGRRMTLAARELCSGHAKVIEKPKPSAACTASAWIWRTAATSTISSPTTTCPGTRCRRATSPA